MEKKYTVEVVDREWFQFDCYHRKELFTVCVYRWIFFGLIPICVKSFFGDDLEMLKDEANDYIFDKIYE